MANALDYMDYLDEKVEIAPANSQEEYQAAETIAELMRDHGLDPAIEEFDAHPMGGLAAHMLALILLVSVIVCGIAQGAIHWAFWVLSALCVGVVLYSHFVQDILGRVGPTARSQNVVAAHRAEGDKVVKGARPIVIVAHYDTPRSGLLWNPPLASYRATLIRVSVVCLMVVAVCQLLQLLLFLPSIALTFFWIVGIIAALPPAVIAVLTILESRGACTPGANDNKSSVAAMLAIMDKVRPAEDHATRSERQHKVKRHADAAPDPVSSAPRRREVLEEIHGVRHGRDMLASLGILPPSCEIVYEEPKVRIVEESEQAPMDQVQDDYVDESVDIYDEESDWIDSEGESEQWSEPTASPEEEGASEEAFVEDEEPISEETSTVTDEDDDHDESDDESFSYEDEPYDETSVYDEEEDSLGSDESGDYTDDYDEIDYESDDEIDYEDDGEWDEGSRFSIGSWFSERVSGIRSFFSSRKKGNADDIQIERGENRLDVDYEDELDSDEWVDDDSQFEDRDEEVQIDDGHVDVEYTDDVIADDYVSEDAFDAGEYDDEYDDDYDDSYEEDVRPWEESSASIEDSSYDLAPDQEPIIAPSVVPTPQESLREELNEYLDMHDIAGEVVSYEEYEEIVYVDEEEEIYEDEVEILYEDETTEDHSESVYDEDDSYVDDSYEEEDALDNELDEEFVDYESELIDVADEDDYLDENTELEYDDEYDDEYDEEYEGYEEPYEDDSYEEYDGEDEILDDEVLQGDGVVEGYDPYDDADVDVSPSLGQRLKGVFRKVRGGHPEETFVEDEETSWEGEDYLEDDEYTTNASEVDSEAGIYYEDDEYYEEQGIDGEETEPEQWYESPVDPNLLHFDREEDQDIVPRDTTGLDTIIDSYDVLDRYEGTQTRQAPEPVNDPTWGTTSYQPARPVMNIARRAALFDLPDPSASTVDPLADDYEEEQTEDAIETPPAANGDQSGFWGDGETPRSGWKGGATMRSDLRDDYADEPLVIDEDELQDAMLAFGDDFLIGHDIWFVATGASTLNHAGIKAFVEQHKRDVRGSFLINLEAIGAGALAVLTKEGLRESRRADRRLVRMLTDIAQDLHIDLDSVSYDWDETESATTMRARLRSVCIMGLDDNNQPAYSHTLGDVPENVDSKQVSSVVRLVTELIRRS